jgi:hypothetical protein
MTVHTSVYDDTESAFGVTGTASDVRDRSTRSGDVMATVSRSSSLARVIGRACLGPFVVLGGLLLLVFGFAALAVAVQVMLVLLGHARV